MLVIFWRLVFNLCPLKWRLTYFSEKWQSNSIMVWHYLKDILDRLTVPLSFWVIPQRLNFICRRFGTPCLIHLHKQVRMKNELVLRNVGVLYGKKFGSRIAWADRKEGDRVGAGQSTETGCGGWPTRRLQAVMWRREGVPYLLHISSMWVLTLHSLFLYYDLPQPCHPPSYWLRLFSSQTFSRIIPQHFSNLFHSTRLPAYEDGTERVFRNVSI
jgi:hypothetical protein